MQDLLEQGLFQFGVPIEKSYTDENGDIIIEGIASAPEKDHQGETLDPRGFILDYFEKSGFIKWEHKGAQNGPAAPSQFIGEPMVAQITPEGQFYLKARLYPHMPLTQEVVSALDGLEKSHSSRKMGFSIEGQALQRDVKNPAKVTKAIIRNVVLTMNPVNGGTWARLAKSLTDASALSVDLDETFSVSKALDTGAAAPIIPQSLEGAKPKKDEDETVKVLTAFRSYCKRALKKQLRKSLLDTSRQNVIMGAYDHAVDCGLSEKEAGDFALYIDEKSRLLKSVLSQAELGGANLMKLADILGESMDELEKSLAPEVTEEDELDALIKSLSEEDDDLEKSIEDEDEDEPKEDKEPKPKGDAPKVPDESNLGGDIDGDNDEDDEPVTKVKKSIVDDMDLMKSMSEDSIQAIEVSDFLDDLVKSVNTTIGGFAEGQEELAKSMAIIGKAVKASFDANKELTELVKGLQDQVEALGAKPVGRRSAITPAEVATVSRQPQPSNELNKSQVMDLLFKGFEKGDVPASAISAYEQGYPLKPEIAAKIGLK